MFILIFFKFQSEVVGNFNLQIATKNFNLDENLEVQTEENKIWTKSVYFRVQHYCHKPIKIYIDNLLLNLLRYNIICRPIKCHVQQNMFQNKWCKIINDTQSITLEYYFNTLDIHDEYVCMFEYSRIMYEIYM